MIVTLDGPAGVGKSSVARKLAESLGWLHVNSGLFYRKAGTMFSGKLEDLVLSFQSYLEIHRLDLPSILSRDPNLVTTEAGATASLVSSYPPLRTLINGFLRQIALEKDIVAEGRDMSTEAFPDALLQVYLDADPEERARRRWREEGGDYERILAQLNERDQRDRNKTVGALKIGPNSYIVDSTYLTIDEVCEKVLRKLRTMIGQGD